MSLLLGKVFVRMQVSMNVDSIPLHRGATVQECQQKIAAYERFVNLQMVRVVCWSAASVPAISTHAV